MSRLTSWWLNGWSTAARLSALLMALVALPALALDYGLKPRQIAPGVWVLEGKREDFTRHNGGDIVNTGFVVTGAGVVVIDSGPSRLYGVQQRAAIGRVTREPVVAVVITHHHPDHWLGNQAYQDVPIHALPATIEGMKAEGSAFADNMYRMAGDWMKGTEPFPATHPIAAERLTVGRRELRFIALSGHTAGDLAVLDKQSGVLFAGDLVFWQRAPTTPHANLLRWQASLDVLDTVPYTRMLPGHGTDLKDGRGIAETRAYLVWLGRTLKDAAERGLDMNEVMALPIPAEFGSMELVRNEFQRSVTHLYSAIERAALEQSVR